MKISRIPLLLLSAALTAGAHAESTPLPEKGASTTAVPSPAILKAGSQVTPQALDSLQWIRGKPYGKWEPGSVYLIECWSSYGDDLMGYNSQVNALHKKYAAKGLRVMGVSVREDDIGVVREFVKWKGDAMSYPVAYAAPGSDFEKEWLEAAATNVSGYHKSFVVKDGKVLLISHFIHITDAVIEAFLAGGEKQAAMLRKIEAEKEAAEKATAKANGMKVRPGSSRENDKEIILPEIKIPSESLTSLNPLSADAPLRWEPGVVYMINFWNNWVDSGMSSAPAANALHKKYSDKGLRVLGVCQFGERTPAGLTVDKLKSFVKDHAREMSYPVVQSPENSDFDQRIKSADLLRRSNHVLFIRDGEILLSTYPKNITDALIEGVLAGGEKQAAVLKEFVEMKRPEIELQKLYRAFPAFLRKGDLDGADDILAKMKAISPKYAPLSELSIKVTAARADIAITRKDWEKVGPLFESLPDYIEYAGYRQNLTGKDTVEPSQGSLGTHARRNVVEKVAASPDAPDSLLRLILDDFTVFAENAGTPSDLKNVMTLNWRLGDKEGALAAARLAVMRHKEPRIAFYLPREPYEKIAASMERGEMPDETTIAGWFREAELKRAPKKR